MAFAHEVIFPDFPQYTFVIKRDRLDAGQMLIIAEKVLLRMNL